MAGADTRPPCRFYQVGQCRAGSICKFAHVKDSTNKLKIAAPCKFFFNQGYCAHGDRCAFSHVKKAEPPRAAAPVPARRAPPPAAAAAPAPPPAPRSPTIQEKLQRVRAKLELDDALPMVKAIEKANAAAGLTAEGPLPAQVDRLLAALHLDDAAPAPAPPPPSSWAGAAASGLREDTPPSPSALSADAVAFKPAAAAAAVTDDGTGFVATAAEAEHSATLTCSVCLELVLPRRKFGVLPNCDHAVCHPCIRTWRGTNAQHAAARQCPECRTLSHHVVPSTVFVTQPERKAALVQAYLQKLKRTPCKHFNFGDGSCPFGSSCFYAHTARDGTAVVIVPRTVENVNGAKCMKTYNLSDYLFPEAGADGGEMLLQQIPVEEEA